MNQENIVPIKQNYYSVNFRQCKMPEYIFTIYQLYISSCTSKSSLCLPFNKQALYSNKLRY